MSRSKADLPIWGRPEPGSRKPRFSRVEIAAVALRIADNEGFEAVSMRRIASELGAGTMSLYRYLETKADLIALMDDALMAEILVASDKMPSSWRAAVTAIARRTRSVLKRHPWALTSLQEARFGPNAMRHFEQFLEAVADTNLDGPRKFELLAVVNDYVFGNVLRVGESLGRAAMAKRDPSSAKAAIEFGLAQLQTGAFPHTKALLGESDPARGLAIASGPALDEEGLNKQFERGLEALLDGLEARMHISPQRRGSRISRRKSTQK